MVKIAAVADVPAGIAAGSAGCTVKKYTNRETKIITTAAINKITAHSWNLPDSSEPFQFNHANAKINAEARMISGT